MSDPAMMKIYYNFRGNMDSQGARLGIVSVAQIIKEISSCYGIMKQVDAITRPIEQNERKMLISELTKSKYSLKEITDFIKNSANVVVLTSEFITINCLEPGANTGCLPVPMITLENIMRRVMCTLRLCKEEKSMIFWIVPCDAIKEFPSPGQLVTPENVNSAFTYTSGDTVFVYRKEELPKVVLHETLHHVCCIDSQLIWTQEQLERMFTIFNINRQTILRPNEAIVETWAELLHMAFIATHYGLNFSMIYEKELQWSLIQAKRILAKQGKNGATWREHTHAFSYYVIKSLFLFSPDAFLEASDLGDMSNIVALAKRVFISEDYARAIHNAALPRHKCFRMTLYGDL